MVHCALKFLFQIIDNLFLELERHLGEGIKPRLEDVEPPTLASTGPDVMDRQALISQKLTRGLRSAVIFLILIKKQRTYYSYLQSQ